MTTRKLMKLGLATAMIASAPSVFDATDAVRAPAYGCPPPITLFYYSTGFYGGGHLGPGAWRLPRGRRSGCEG
jgi:hypothetical protein